ncbi:MAG: FtsQ-type POTRA domain-containing protein [Candidatus Mcinerneyibacterium aminivorans]|uniref:FtsQ-type POTRA domain-containing protein n=1 Tax=Candidatus Mcinerneyibacterium aminivorans TaxID=2703815 RepID=A0A5D0MA81_9BACT|nr:MAG: FtsQ-type POTRA domain-containing protein [Candidatus Mcinerneyibacterium aminivorans]
MRHRRKKNYLKPVIKTALVLFLIGGLFFLVYRFMINWNEFNIKQVNIRGNKRISGENITKYFEGKNLLDIDLNKIKKQIEKLKTVKSVKIKKELPDKIEVIVRERMPLAMMKKDNGYVLVDEEGKYFDKETKEIYPVLENNDQIDKKLEALKYYHKYKTEIEKCLLEKVVMLNNYDVGFVIKINNQRVSLNIGRNQFGQKFAALNEIMDRKKETTQKIDLRFLPYVVYKDGGG